MPVPTNLSDLSTTASSNSPQGSESIGTSLDEYLRATQAIIAKVGAGTNALTTPSLGAATATSINGTTIPSSKTLLVSTDIGSTVQGYDATTLKSSAIGVSVQGYDADIPTVSASQAEMEAGTEVALRSMSPLRVKQAISALAPNEIPSQTGNSGKYLTTNGSSASWGSVLQAKAWVNFDGTLSGTITPRAGSNIASVVKNGTGDYTITFTNALADANYVLSGACRRGATNDDVHVAFANAASPTSSVCRISTQSGGAAVDCSIVSIVIHGN